MKKSSLLCLGLIVLFVAGCTTPDVVDQEVAGYTYFPLEAGRYTEYEINEVRYTVTSSTPKTTTYFLKEVCGQPYAGLTGVPQFPIERYKKGTLAANWTLDSVWTAYRLPDRAVRVENNTAFVKMSFPLAEESTWNGNLLNTYPEEAYKAHFEVPSPTQKEFPGSLTVVQRRRFQSGLAVQTPRSVRARRGAGLQGRYRLGILPGTRLHRQWQDRHGHEPDHQNHKLRKAMTYLTMILPLYPLPFTWILYTYNPAGCRTSQ